MVLPDRGRHNMAAARRVYVKQLEGVPGASEKRFAGGGTKPGTGIGRGRSAGKERHVDGPGAIGPVCAGIPRWGRHCVVVCFVTTCLLVPEPSLYVHLTLKPDRCPEPFLAMDRPVLT